MPEKIIKFRNVEEGDLYSLMTWRNEHKDMFRQYRLLTMDDQRQWLQELRQDRNRMIFAVYEEAEDREEGMVTMVTEHLIGYCGLYDIDWLHRKADLGIMVGYRGSGYGTLILNELHRIAFMELNLHRMQLEVFAFNPALHLYTRAGYREVGRWRHAHFHNGDWHEVILMDMLASEWQPMEAK